MGKPKTTVQKITIKGAPERTLKSFLLSTGNSTDGPVGFCVRVRAYSKTEALAKVKAALLEQTECVFDEDEDGEPNDIEYGHVYFNAEALTVADFEDGETEEVK